MGKVKKRLESDKKTKIVAGNLNKIKKGKSIKSARKNLGAIPASAKISPKVLEEFDVTVTKSMYKRKTNSLGEDKSPKLNTKGVSSSNNLLNVTEEKSSVKSDTKRDKKRKTKFNAQESNNVLADDNRFEIQSNISEKSKKNTSKIAKEFKSNETTKIKKSSSLKNKAQVFKVNTALIFNQKSNRKERDDSEVNVDEDSVRSGINALFKVIENKKGDKSLFDDVVPIFLHFSCIKMAKTPSRTLRIPLKHSLLKDTSEICLITDDARGFRKEFEKTIEHYQEFLKEKNVNNIKTIMPFYQLKTEYSEFELKRKLVELYDAFLVDAKVSGYVVKKLGKIFMEKRKLPVPIRLTANRLKENIDFALRKTSTNLHPHSDNFVMQIGHSEMTEDEIYDNFQEVCEHLAKQFPGGWENIRGLNLKTPKSLAIPVYYTMKKSSEVPVPIVKAKRPKAFKVVKGELSTAFDAEVEVLPTGDVNLKERKKSKKKRKLSEGSKVNGTANGFSDRDEIESDKKSHKKEQKKMFKKSQSGKQKIKSKILDKLKMKTKLAKDSKKIKSNGKLQARNKEKKVFAKNKKIKSKKGEQK